MARESLFYLRCRVLNNDYIFSNLKLKFYGPQQYSRYGATLSTDRYCLHTHMMSINWARGWKFPSSLTYGAEPLSILTTQYKLMLSEKNQNKTKQNKTKNNIKRITFELTIANVDLFQLNLDIQPLNIVLQCCKE